MSAAAWLAALGGYDGEAVELLFEAQHRRQLAWLGVAALGSAAVLALGCGLLAWWASSSQWATWVTASSAFLFFANVFRLLGAGSGVSVVKAMSCCLATERPMVANSISCRCDRYNALKLPMQNTT